MKIRFTGRVHDLKTWRAQYAAVRADRKPFEWRKDDRDFAVGDVLNLREWDESAGRYTNYNQAVLGRVVTYVLRFGFGMPVGYVILGLAKIPKRWRTR